MNLYSCPFILSQIEDILVISIFNMLNIYIKLWQLSPRWLYNTRIVTRVAIITTEEVDSEGTEKMVVERDIDDLPKNAANYTALTPLWLLERAAVVHPNRKSVIHGSLQYTWLETYQRCRQLASALSKYSIGAGSTVLRFLTSLKFSFFCLVDEKMKEKIRKFENLLLNN